MTKDPMTKGTMPEDNLSEIISYWVTDLTAQHAAGVNTPARADAVSKLLDEAATDADFFGVGRDTEPGSLDERFTAAYLRLKDALHAAYRRDDVYAVAVSRARPADADDTLCSFGWKFVPIDPDLAVIVLHDSPPRTSNHGVARSPRWVYDALVAENHHVTTCERFLPDDAVDVAARLWDPYNAVLRDFSDVCDIVGEILPA